MFIEQLLKLLTEAGVKYCVIGGVAVNLHGIPRMTYDVDLVVDLTKPNLEAVEQVLTELNLSCRLPLELSSLSDGTVLEEYKQVKNLKAVTFTDVDNPLNEVDILISTPVPPSELINRALQLDLDGAPVKIVSIEDLITLKEYSNRAQDQDDTKLLNKILEDDHIEENS